MIRLQKLVIEKFRSFKTNSEILFDSDKNVFLISGVNGTAKSTLLGMISQPLGFPNRSKAKSLYTNAYDDIDFTNLFTLSGKYFKADFADIFRLSQKFDKAREHKYSLFLSGEPITSGSTVQTSGLQVRSEKREDQPENNIRFVTNSFSRKAGEGNFPHPVIYLGLERLRPLSTLKKKDIIAPNYKLEDDELKLWINIYKTVMITGANDSFQPEFVETGKTFKHSYHSVLAETFDAESASAGQDNLGQIITAIISFKNLKKQLQNHYQGGLLLIDEIDATFHPIAQKLLLEKIIELARDIKFQVIATTHSLTLLEAASKEYHKDVSLIYLKKRKGDIQPFCGISYDDICADLAHVREFNKPIKTCTLLFEDVLASHFFTHVTGNIFKKYVKSYNCEKNNSDTAMPNDVLSHLASYLAVKKIPEFEKMIFILDPDSHKIVKKVGKKNLIALPGNDAIEKQICDFLYRLPDDDCWESTFKISYSEFIEGYNTLYDENDNNGKKTKKYKEWFNKHKNNGIWGRGECILFKFWSKKHKDLCRDFCFKVLDALKFVDYPLESHEIQNIKEAIDKNFGEKSINSETCDKSES